MVTCNYPDCGGECIECRNPVSGLATDNILVEMNEIKGSVHLMGSKAGKARYVALRREFLNRT